MPSLFDVTNSLKVQLAVVVAGVQLAVFDILFSESVPNLEQAEVIKRLFAFSSALTAEFSANAASGSLFDPAGQAKVSFQVLAADGTVLESFTGEFDSSVPNAEQALLLDRLADFAATLAGENV